ncbi:MAG: Mrp/NBP35 family ATP-binding protein [Hyphomicrobiaceae bacterium]
MARALTKDTVLEALRAVTAPGGKASIVDQGLVSEIVLANAKVYFSITVPPDRASEMEPMRRAAEAAVQAIPGVEGVNAALTAERPAAAREPARASSGSGAPQPRPGRGQPVAVAGIASIIAVASGKGGVGKSTTAVNLALGLKSLGLAVGMLDADVYGPSLPRLLGLSGRPQVKDNRLQPMQAYGLKIMSMGFLVDEATPVIWRGPMVMQALTQMLREVDWGTLDVLVVDMPPGTGDVQLTMAQQVGLKGAVIVSTPQDLALIDARKGLNMFRQVEVPVLGIVENMSYFVCPSCGRRSDIFGHGGAEAEAGKLGVPFLGAVPLHMTIRETSDRGEPVTAIEPDGPLARPYRAIAEKVASALAGGTTKAAPRIVVE